MVTRKRMTLTERVEALEDQMTALNVALTAFTAEQKKVKERITLAVWILVTAGGAFNFLGPEVSAKIIAAFAS